MNEFVVPVVLTVSCDVLVQADSPEEAQRQAESMDWEEYLSHGTEYVESEIITSDIRRW